MAHAGAGQGVVTMKHRKAWNGGSREAAIAAAKLQTELAIGVGCLRCPACAGEGPT